MDNAVSDPRLILLDPSTRYYIEAESLTLKSQAWKIGFSDVRIGINCDSFIDNFTRIYDELVETYSLGKPAETSLAHEQDTIMFAFTTYDARMLSKFNFN